MNIETWPIEKVIPYARNPRKNDGAVAVVAGSLKEFGWRQPLVVDREGVLIVGHTRLLAARQLGMTEVPVHVADLTQAQAKAYRIADNKSSDAAEWDFDLLRLELDDLKALDVPLDMTGFSLDDLPAVMDSIPDENKAIDEDAMRDTENECPKCGFKW